MFVLTLLAACFPPPNISVEERTTIDPRLEAERLGGSHLRIVQPGDTLYGIAFANRLEASTLAAWNRLSLSDKLLVGQRIRLTQPIDFKAPPKVNPSTISKPSIARPQPTKPSKLAKGSTPHSRATKAWEWPIKGPLITSFDPADGRQGVDIGGRMGDPIRATRAGEIVYVGNSLKGYGNLVIIKHDERYLSAYAHNQEIFVIEGERVKAKQRIAAMGRNIRGVVALQFQIRLDGEPINPINFLTSS